MRTYHESVDAWLEHRRVRDTTNTIPAELMRAAKREMRAEGATLAVISRIRAGAPRRAETP
jgi:hypothetical protein